MWLTYCVLTKEYRYFSEDLILTILKAGVDLVFLSSGKGGGE